MDVRQRMKRTGPNQSIGLRNRIASIPSPNVRAQTKARTGTDGSPKVSHPKTGFDGPVAIARGTHLIPSRSQT